MIEYKDFQLTPEQINWLKEKNAQISITNYIKEHGAEPENIKDFYVISDEEIEKYRKNYYSVYYSKIRKINDIIKKDYDELYSESNDLIYWESHMVLNKKLEDSKNLFELYPISIENVFEINSETNPIVIIRTTNLITGKMTESRKHDVWFESHRIYPDDSILELNDALKAYWNSSIRRTTGNKVSLRRPLNPMYNHPYYIIGQENSPLFIFVDSVTGEILYEYK